MDSNAKEFWHVRAPIERPFVPNKDKTYSSISELTTVLPIENWPMARMLICVRNRHCKRARSNRPQSRTDDSLVCGLSKNAGRQTQRLDQVTLVVDAFARNIESGAGIDRTGKPTVMFTPASSPSTLMGPWP
jgi:hypothetical protein